MRHVESWRPSKFVFVGGLLRSSRDPQQVAVHSRLIADRTAEFYQSSLRAHARGHLLDLGCGKVPLFGAYKELVSQVTCVDWGNSLHGNLHIDAAVDLTGPLPFADSVFDTIVLSDVLEHLPNPDHLWMEMGRIMRPGGKLIMNVPFLYWIHEQPFDYHRYTEFALRRSATTAGFRDCELTSLGGSPEVLADILAKNACVLPQVGPTLAAWIQGLASCVTRRGFGQRISLATRHGFPLSYGMVARR